MKPRLAVAALAVFTTLLLASCTSVGTIPVASESSPSVASSSAASAGTASREGGADCPPGELTVGQKKTVTYKAETASGDSVDQNYTLIGGECFDRVVSEGAGGDVRTEQDQLVFATVCDKIDTSAFASLLGHGVLRVTSRAPFSQESENDTGGLCGFGPANGLKTPAGVTVLFEKSVTPGTAFAEAFATVRNSAYSVAQIKNGPVATAVSYKRKSGGEYGVIVDDDNGTTAEVASTSAELEPELPGIAYNALKLAANL